MPVRSKLFYVYVACALLYAASFLLPRSIGSLQQYHLSILQYRLLSITVFIPLVAIWYAAFFGYHKLRVYNRLIAGSPDGRHLSHITIGIMLIALGLPASSLVSAATTILIQHIPHIVTAATIIKNYAVLILPLAGFFYISLGARGLNGLARQRASYRATNLLGIIFITISLVYCYIVLTSHNLQILYHMPTWLVLATIVGPYLYTWFIGFHAVYELRLYSRRAPGTLYRKAWNMLANGLAAIIVMQIAVQYIGTITVQFQSLRLVRLLIMVYVLLALLSVGYLLVAIGARRLQKIEEV